MVGLSANVLAVTCVFWGDFLNASPVNEYKKFVGNEENKKTNEAKRSAEQSRNEKMRKLLNQIVEGEHNNENQKFTNQKTALQSILNNLQGLEVDSNRAAETHSSQSSLHGGSACHEDDWKCFFQNFELRV